MYDIYRYQVQTSNTPPTYSHLKSKFLATTLYDKKTK